MKVSENNWFTSSVSYVSPYPTLLGRSAPISDFIRYYFVQLLLNSTTNQLANDKDNGLHLC